MRSWRALTVFPGAGFRNPWPAAALVVGCAAIFLGVVAPAFAASEAGPTLRLNDGRGGVETNGVGDFMYFVPLICPEPVAVTNGPAGDYRVRLLSLTRRKKTASFQVKMEFEFLGKGSQENLIDCTNTVKRHEAKLKQGGRMERVLGAINVEGPGKGIIEIEGSVSNGVERVNSVRLRFNAHGEASPVAIVLHDLEYRDGELRAFNEISARVNTLSFQRSPGRPRMEVTVASVKPKNAKDNFWQNLKGGIKGMAANLMIPPISVEARGHETMLAFGGALVSQDATFTFPLATNLVSRITSLKQKNL